METPHDLTTFLRVEVLGRHAPTPHLEVAPDFETLSCHELDTLPVAAAIMTEWVSMARHAAMWHYHLSVSFLELGCGDAYLARVLAAAVFRWNEVAPHRQLPVLWVHGVAVDAQPHIAWSRCRPSDGLVLLAEPGLHSSDSLSDFAFLATLRSFVKLTATRRRRRTVRRLHVVSLLANHCDALVPWTAVCANRLLCRLAAEPEVKCRSPVFWGAHGLLRPCCPFTLEKRWPPSPVVVRADYLRYLWKLARLAGFRARWDARELRCVWFWSPGPATVPGGHCGRRSAAWLQRAAARCAVLTGQLDPRLSKSVLSEEKQ